MRYKYKAEHFPGGVRLCTYEKGIYKGDRRWDSSRKEDIPDEERKEKDAENLKRSLRRTAKKIERIIRSNFYSDPNTKMITLTYKTNMQDWDRLIREWQEFKSFLLLDVPDLKYIAVCERQERQAWHLHVVCSFEFLPWEDLLSAWRLCIEEDGGVYLSYRKKNPEHAATYLSSYLTDEKYLESQRFQQGKKRYWTNLRDLTRVTYTNNLKDVADLVGVLEEEDRLQSEYTYEGASVGNAKVQTFTVPTVDSASVEALCSDIHTGIVCTAIDKTMTPEEAGEYACRLHLNNRPHLCDIL